MAVPLAESKVGILAIAYETDYVLVRKSQLDLAAQTLRERATRSMNPDNAQGGKMLEGKKVVLAYSGGWTPRSA